MSEPSAARSPVSAAANAALFVRVTGAVQGVGFRPFVHGLAASLDVAGEVRNTGAGVEIEVEGSSERLERFVRALIDEAPPLALVEEVFSEPRPPLGRCGFTIAPSLPGTRVDTLVTADAATCDDCLREVFDPADRRYRYPFTNCTNCGPRFTITRSVPYDRPNTTMAGFTMCPACSAEYEDPGDRRFHAQPNACPACGPRLSFVWAAGDSLGEHSRGQRAPAAPQEGTAVHEEAALRSALEVLETGGTLAVKGLGGYHLVCDALDRVAVERLRMRKHRDEKPFAVMMTDTAEVARYCRMSPEEAALLQSPRRPIVLLERLAEGLRLAAEVAPGLPTYGVFLPYTPLHHLLLRDHGGPLVMTSGNLTDEPIAYRDDDAHARLDPLADAFLAHDRPIHIRTDDSVARVHRGRPYTLRRARGFAPLPVRFSGCDREILAVGAHLKNAFCITRGDRAFVSHHVGDLENLETLRSLEEGVGHFSRLFGLKPEVVAHDLHPDYLSTRFARRFAQAADLPLFAIQHHEAHVASVLAETGYQGTVVGIAFDGAGLGPDGTIWGGEIFVGRAGTLTRVAHLEQQLLPGGDAAVREPWRLAVVQLAAAIEGPAGSRSEATGIGKTWPGTDGAGRGATLDVERIARRLAKLPRGEAFARLPWQLVLQAARRRVNTPVTTSAGRLFDTIASLLGLRHTVAYEGQAAIMLEAAARRFFAGAGLPSPDAPAPWESFTQEGATMDSIAGGCEKGPEVIRVRPLIGATLHDLEGGVDIDEIAARFHHVLARETVRTAMGAADRYGASAVALSGGVFQNMLLLELVTAGLERAGLQVLLHRGVPTNDGGICLGQAETAAALLSAGGTTGGGTGEYRSAVGGPPASGPRDTRGHS